MHRCFRVPGIHYMNFELLGLDTPSELDYDDYCRDCWGAKGDRPGASGEASDRSLETDSSDEDDEDAAPEVRDTPAGSTPLSDHDDMLCAVAGV